MRFLLDMGLSPATAEFLRGLGHDAVHLRDRGLQRLSDDGILALALQEGRAIASCDLDFTRLIARTGRPLPSLILFRLETYAVARINRLLQNLLKQHAHAIESGAIVVVEEERTRIRLLPIVPGG